MVKSTGSKEKSPPYHYRQLNSPVPTPSKRQLAKAQLCRMAPPEKRPVIKPQPKFKRIYRQYSDDFKLVLVVMRFGSLTDFSNPVRSCFQVAKELNVNEPVVSRACANYQAIGDVSVKWKRPGQTRKFSPEVLDDMISPRALQDQKFLSLNERRDMLWEKHGVSVSTKLLQGLYKRNGIGHRFSRPNVSVDSLDWSCSWTRWTVMKNRWKHRNRLASETFNSNS